MTEVTPAMLNRIEAGSSRLYQRDFLGLSWLADYVADVDSVCMAYEEGRLMEGPMTTTTPCTHSWAQDDFLKGIRCANCGASGWDWARAENRRLEADLADYKAGADEEARAGDEARESLALADADVETLQGVVAQLTSANERLQAVMEDIAEAARDLVACADEHSGCSHIDRMREALGRLDAAVPAASAGEAS